MKRMLALLTTITLLGTTLMGCGGSSAQQNGTSAQTESTPAVSAQSEQQSDANPAATEEIFSNPVAIAMDNLNHPVHRIVQLGFLKKAQDLGYTNAEVIGTEGSDPSEVMAACEAFAAEGGKGLLLWYGDSACYETVASVASKGVVVGIPLFNHRQEDGTLPEGLSFNMAPDVVDYSKKAAQLMAQTLDGKQGVVAITQNTKNVMENTAAQTFADELEVQKANYNLEGVTVLEPQLEGGVIDQATAVNLAIIQSNPTIIGAFGTTGNSPVTWADAASKAGKADGELAIIGMDATIGNLDYLEGGKVLAIIANPLYEQASLIMEYLDKHFRGESVPEWTDLEAPIVTRDGEGPNGPEYHRNIASEVDTFFQ